MGGVFIAKHKKNSPSESFCCIEKTTREERGSIEAMPMSKNIIRKRILVNNFNKVDVLHNEQTVKSLPLEGKVGFACKTRMRWQSKDY